MPVLLFDEMFSRKGKRSTAEVPVPTEAAELAPVEASEGKDDIQDEADALKDWAKKGRVYSMKCCYLSLDTLRNKQAGLKSQIYKARSK